MKIKFNKIIENMKKREEFLPTLILVLTTLIIIFLGYSLNKKSTKKVAEQSKWKVQNGIFIPLTLEEISPNVGPTTGNTEVTIKGKGLSKDLKMFAGSSTNIHQKSIPIQVKSSTSNQIIVIMPSHSPGEVEIFAIYNGNAVSAKNLFTYKGDIPDSSLPTKITAISTTLVTPGKNITIVGEGFAKINTIKLGQNMIPSIESKNNRMIVFTLPNELNSPMGKTKLIPGKYDLSILADNRESNFVTMEIK